MGDLRTSSSDKALDVQPTSQPPINLVEILTRCLFDCNSYVATRSVLPAMLAAVSEWHSNDRSAGFKGREGEEGVHGRGEAGGGGGELTGIHPAQSG